MTTVRSIIHTKPVFLRLYVTSAEKFDLLMDKNSMSYVMKELIRIEIVINLKDQRKEQQLSV